MTPDGSARCDFAFVGADEPAEAVAAQAADPVGPLGELPVQAGLRGRGAGMGSTRLTSTPRINRSGPLPR